MSTWIKASLREAIAALAQSGKSDVAADLGRLLADNNIDALDIYRSPEVERVALALHECETLEALCGILRRVATAFGTTYVTINCIRERSPTFYTTKVLTTLPKKWVAEYVDRRYSGIDPILATCRRGPGTFLWDMEKAGADPFTKHFIKAAVDNGIGPSGITRVEQTALGSTIALSLSSTQDQKAFRKSFYPKLSDFHDIGSLLIEVFSELACERNDASFNASDDQLKVLRALAAGKTLAEVEALPFLYGSFKTIEKSILRSFGAKTLTQAAALAVNRGILEDLPYFSEDVFSEEPNSEDGEGAPCLAAE